MSEDEELERIKARKLRKLLNLSRGDKEMKGPGGKAEVYELSEGSFDNFIVSTDKPVLVDFWAEWCMPCLAMAPVIEELAKKYAGEVAFAKVNVDENPGLASRLGVYGIPTFVVFLKGRELKRIVGAVGKAKLEAELASITRWSKNP